jgi:hypothetical protein
MTVLEILLLDWFGRDDILSLMTWRAVVRWLCIAIRQRMGRRRLWLTSAHSRANYLRNLAKGPKLVPFVSLFSLCWVLKSRPPNKVSSNIYRTGWTKHDQSRHTNHDRSKEVSIFSAFHLRFWNGGLCALTFFFVFAFLHQIDDLLK